MASGHLDWPVRSVLKKHVSLPNVLFMVLLKFSTILRQQDGRLHGRQFPSSATRQTGSILKIVRAWMYFIFLSFK